MNRRDVLRVIGAASLVEAIPGLLGAARRHASPFFEPDVELALTAGPGEAQVLPGARTRVWRFTGAVLKGPAESLQIIADSYLGPVIRLRRGQKVRIRFRNNLPESSIVHWHGLDVPSAMDGHPHSLIDPGTEFVYEFEVINRAGTYWYHPHPHERTGPQVYRGLAGLLLISDDEEAALALPRASEELLCVLQDRHFDGDNQLLYMGNGMMDGMMGFLGDRILVNGKERPTLSLATRAYRLRILNGSNARIYKLAWDDGTPLTVVGGDGGLLERPVEQRYLALAPAQRADVIVDLSKRAVGSTLQLVSAPYPAAEVSMTEMGMGGMMGGAAVPNGAPLQLLTIRVERNETSTFRLPARLSTFDANWTRSAPGATRKIAISARQMMWLLGGRTFEMMETAPDEEAPVGSTQVWEFVNGPGMIGMQMAHPIHMHGKQFRVLERSSASTPVVAGSLREGLLDAGWQDTVLVMPGESVKVQVHFSNFPGLYLYHCHILEHEDMGMMRNFRVLPA